MNFIVEHLYRTNDEGSRDLSIDVDKLTVKFADDKKNICIVRVPRGLNGKFRYVRDDLDTHVRVFDLTEKDQPVISKSLDKLIKAGEKFTFTKSKCYDRGTKKDKEEEDNSFSNQRKKKNKYPGRGTTVIVLNNDVVPATIFRKTGKTTIGFEQLLAITKKRTTDALAEVPGINGEENQQIKRCPYNHRTVSFVEKAVVDQLTKCIAQVDIVENEDGSFEAQETTQEEQTTCLTDDKLQDDVLLDTEGKQNAMIDPFYRANRLVKRIISPYVDHYTQDEWKSIVHVLGGKAHMNGECGIATHIISASIGNKNEKEEDSRSPGKVMKRSLKVIMNKCKEGLYTMIGGIKKALDIPEKDKRMIVNTFVGEYMLLLGIQNKIEKGGDVDENIMEDYSIWITLNGTVKPKNRIAKSSYSIDELLEDIEIQMKQMSPKECEALKADIVKRRVREAEIRTARKRGKLDDPLMTSSNVWRNESWFSPLKKSILPGFTKMTYLKMYDEMITNPIETVNEEQRVSFGTVCEDNLNWFNDYISTKNQLIYLGKLRMFYQLNYVQIKKEVKEMKLNEQRVKIGVMERTEDGGYKRVVKKKKRYRCMDSKMKKMMKQFIMCSDVDETVNKRKFIDAILKKFTPEDDQPYGPLFESCRNHLESLETVSRTDREIKEAAKFILRELDGEEMNKRSKSKTAKKRSITYTTSSEEEAASTRLVKKAKTDHVPPTTEGEDEEEYESEDNLTAVSLSGSSNPDTSIDQHTMNSDNDDDHNDDD